MVNPTGYTALDLVGFTDRGDYVNNANYVKNDLVSYLGSIWRCLVDDTTGIAPAEGVNWTLFMAQPSSNVEQIIAPVEQATATEAIAIGDQFIYNDILYEATAAIAQGGNIIIPPNAGANCKVSDTIVKQIKSTYSTNDGASATINDTDYVPLSDNSGNKKKSLWSTIVAKIKTTLGTAAVKDVPASGNASNTQVVLGSDTRLSDSRTPTAHASTATTYGAGNASNFGHVKLSDTYNSNVGAAANSIGASQKAIYDAYAFLGKVNSFSDTAFSKSSLLSAVYVNDFQRIGGIVFAQLDFVIGSTFSAYTVYTIGKIVNAAFLPSTTVFSVAQIDIDDVEYAFPARVDINSNGDITFSVRVTPIQAGKRCIIHMIYRI